EIAGNLALKDPRIRVFRNPAKLSSAGRNIGIKNATGNIITFIDGHTYIGNNQLLRNIVLLMEKEGLSILSRPQFMNTPHNSFFQKAVSAARKSLIGHGLGSTIYNPEDKRVNPMSSGATYRREVFEKIGLFDEKFDACEDVELNYRAYKNGYDSFTSMKLAVFYYPRASVTDLFRQMKRYGMGRLRLARKHPETLSLGTLLPFFITLSIPLFAVLSLVLNPLYNPLLFLIGSYLLSICGWSLVVSLRENITYLFVLPLIYFSIHFGLGWGFLTELIRTIFGKSAIFDK
ncbi:MAG: glycosyltransferase family 2 protein, partial [Candidatus Zixiibacteriota bacterium]